MNHQELVVIDHMGNETMYDRKLLRNWRNFLKAKGAGRRSWSVRHMPHMLQKDSSSCGVLVLKFAETYVQMGGLQAVQTGPKDISQARLHIATTLYQHRDKVEEYCVECNMLHCNASENIIDMIQCDCCSRWTHKECATDMGDMFIYIAISLSYAYDDLTTHGYLTEQRPWSTLAPHLAPPLPRCDVKADPEECVAVCGRAPSGFRAEPAEENIWTIKKFKMSVRAGLLGRVSFCKLLRKEE
ncbi:uncharacterized protein LOC119797885 [Cyprinodon tularosa]|uniref:uncharacterized protein LOC119797885 n=1 Tax=Cyprinodon tularosa TaxID=77115 RepID=UPI0018E20524|nr:uncharacterized protein LOC119797885 [Cyprinodon tularosa]